MKTSSFKKLIGVLAVLVVGMALASPAFAGCGDTKGVTLHKQSWDGSFNPDMLLRVSTAADPIVGFWKVTLSIGGTPIDSAYAQWHADGTEIMNSSKPPSTSSFCLGVWRRSSPFHYKLNHFAISYNGDGQLVGPTNIREEIVLDKSGSKFTGTFTIDDYDTNGNQLDHIEGDIAATRITVNTTPQAVF